MPSFSFPALTAGPPSRRNWYQELLDHPDCHGPQQVSEAYTSHRAAYLAKNLASFNSDTNPVTPDQALLSHLRQQKNAQEANEPSTEDMNNLEVNCLGISARPSSLIVTKIEDIQTKFSKTIGSDFYIMPTENLHIAIVELAHRHTLSYLHSVSSSVGTERLQNMLDLISTLPSKPRLIAPQLSIDAMGVALTFLPDPEREYTYHHLRAEMHGIALTSGGGFDMCYTAPSAHVTLGRFVGSGFFEEKDGRDRIVDLVEEINGELEEEKDRKGWVLGEQLSLELQAGYLKFGVERGCANMLGRSG